MEDDKIFAYLNVLILIFLLLLIIAFGGYAQDLRFENIMIENRNSELVKENTKLTIELYNLENGGFERNDWQL